ncbi:MAG: hypothetical protein ABR975_12285 [Vulcanimicrobiaceae bacterium]|jgi:hypothetical protein
MRLRLLLSLVLVAFPLAARAQTLAPMSPTPTTSPTPAPSASPTGDYCSNGGLGALVSRPTQTNSVCVVPSGHTLIETGYQSQTVLGGAAGLTYQSVPDATVRIASPLHDVEVQVFPPIAYRVDGTSATSDIGIGLKWQIAATPTFAYGVSASNTLVTGTNPLTNVAGLGSATVPTQNYSAQFAWQLGKVFGLAGGLELSELASALATGPQHYASTLPSLELSDALPASWSLFVEGFTQSHGEGPGTPTHVWGDAGVSKDIGSAQLDVEYGASNAIVVAPSLPLVRRHYVGAGVSYEF